jgi:hypothetical protein
MKHSVWIPVGMGMTALCMSSSNDDRTYAAKITGTTDSVGIPPAPLIKGGGRQPGGSCNPLKSVPVRKSYMKRPCWLEIS